MRLALPVWLPVWCALCCAAWGPSHILRAEGETTAALQDRGPTTAAGSTEQPDSPEVLYVARDRTILRSGPGDEHYPTDTLGRGVAVEVYERGAGGWLGIRPPPASFSWVSARDVELAGGAQPSTATEASETVGQVVGSAVVAWIGSNVAEVNDHQWLVKLDAGEAVQVLGKERRRLVSNGKTDLFLKVAPPAGEFRWIHEDDVVPEPPTNAVRDPEVSLADFRVAIRGSSRPSAPQPPAIGSTSRNAGPGAEPRTAESRATEPRRDSFTSRNKSSGGRVTVGSEGLTASGRISARDLTRGSSPAAPRTDRNLSADTGVPLKDRTTPGLQLGSDVESSLRDLDAELSLMVAKPVDQWNFSALRAAAEQYLQGNSTLDRARVQVFLDKLSDFEGLKSRHALMAPKPAPAALLPAAAKTGPAAANAAGTTAPRWDGTGWLLPVHSAKKASPPFALLDKDGNILQFVSPAPGLNLNRYLRKEVGILGQKDQPPTLDKPHLTAHRVVELDRQRR